MVIKIPLDSPLNDAVPGRTQLGATTDNSYKFN